MSDKSKATEGAARAALSKEELIAALASLSPGEKRALLGAGPSVGEATPKMSPAIDAIPDAEVSDVIKACARALKVQTNAAEFGAACAEITKRWPVLMSAMEVNARYRHASIQHSMNVVMRKLTIRKEA